MLSIIPNKHIKFAPFGRRTLAVSCRLCERCVSQNSVYSVSVIDDDRYLVSGAVFDRKGLSPMKTTIRGCNWGGSTIKEDIVAGCGMFLEFGNGVVTSRIEQVRLIPSGAQN